MKLLLDTHAFIWWDSDASRLSQKARDALNDPANKVYFSVVSIWEMVIKTGLGKMSPRIPLRQLATEQQANGLQLLPVTLPHVLAVESLAPLHKDPFDRLLVGQAMVEQMHLVSADVRLVGYGASMLW